MAEAIQKVDKIVSVNFESIRSLSVRADASYHKRDNIVIVRILLLLVDTIVFSICVGILIYYFLMYYNGIIIKS
ncbi:MAG: hypothetical protein LBV22_03235 [Mycoplasmataceae bacterium]|jgi:hypothetical protein|nr:hypothetical protein [Mycoplasmataceae bacterium]